MTFPYAAWIEQAKQAAEQEARMDFGEPDTPGPLVTWSGSRIRPAAHAFIARYIRPDLKPLLDRFGFAVEAPRRPYYPDESEVYLCPDCKCFSAYDQYEHIDVGVGVQSYTSGVRCDVCEEIWHERGCPRSAKTPTWEEDSARRGAVLDMAGKQVAFVGIPDYEQRLHDGQARWLAERAAEERVEKLLCVNLLGDGTDRLHFRPLKEYRALLEELAAPLRAAP